MSNASHFNSTGLKARLPTTHCTTGLRHAKQYHRERAANRFFLNTWYHLLHCNLLHIPKKHRRKIKNSIKGLYVFFSCRLQNWNYSWSSYVLFFPSDNSSSSLRDVTLLSRKWHGPPDNVQIHCDAAQILLLLLFETGTFGKQILLIQVFHGSLLSQQL